MVVVLSDLSARADLRGGRIDVTWVWSGLGPRPHLRLLRRRRALPDGPEDGYPVLDLGELFRLPEAPWHRVSRLRFTARGSSAEGGLLQAALTFFLAAPEDPAPARVEIAVHDPVTGSPVAERIEAVSAVDLVLPDPGPWRLVEALAVHRTPDGAPATPAGVVTVLRDHVDPATPSRLRWEPASGEPVETVFDDVELLVTRADNLAATERDLSAAWSRTVQRDGADLGSALSASAGTDAHEADARIALHEEVSDDTGDRTRSVRATDLGAAVEEVAYYRLFRPDPSAPGGWASERGWDAHATPTAGYGFPDRLYALLPSVHQYYDEPSADERRQGQLRRFLQVFGVTLDHLRSGAEGLRTRHDVAQVRGDFLPAIGGWIGWPTDRSAALPTQRADIRMAPDVYATVGTLPNIAALATRVTGWPCEAKEFVHNLFTVGGTQAVPVRELWEMRHDGSGFGPPTRLTTTPDFDGHPVAAREPDGRTRLFWHSNRSGRWALWTRLVDEGDGTDGDGTAPRLLDEPAEDALPLGHADLHPTAIRFPGPGGDRLWLLWESDRGGAWDVWARVDDGAGWAAPFPVTAHRSADRRPAAAIGPDAALWVFWESERRGAPEIWSRVHDGAAWSPSVRVTEGLGRDHEPAAALDGSGRLWLVWRRDEADRSRLYRMVLDAGAWGPAAPLEDGPWRDEAPALVRRGTTLWLLWHSDRTGRWELWGRVHDGGVWGEPFQITMAPDADKEPAVLLDGADLRVFWRSERRAMEHRSRTVDVTDVASLERRGLVDDRLHYTYDTAREPTDHHARDVVGLYLTPPRGTPAEVVDEVLARAAAYLDPFCPATVRLVLLPARAAESADFHVDFVDADDPIIDEFQDDLT